MRNSKWNPHWTPSSNEQLAKFANNFAAQQSVVNNLGEQIFPKYGPVDKIQKILRSLQVFLALVFGHQLMPNLVWYEFGLDEITTLFPVLNWLYHPTYGWHVENMLYNQYKKDPTQYKKFFNEMLLSVACSCTNLNEDVTHTPFSKTKAFYNKKVLLRLLRLHLNLFNPELVEKAKKLGILYSFLRSMVQLSRENGTYKYVSGCMEPLSLKMVENGEWMVVIDTDRLKAEAGDEASDKTSD